MTIALHTFMYYWDWFHICKDLTEGEINKIKSLSAEGSVELHCHIGCTVRFTDGVGTVLGVWRERTANLPVWHICVSVCEENVLFFFNLCKGSGVDLECETVCI
jgi:hypothetical protein